MKHFACLAVLLAAACAHNVPIAPPPSTRARAAAARETREFAAAYELYADALCEALATDPHDPDGAALARTNTELWEALGRPEPAPRVVQRCSLTPPLALYVEALVAASMANWSRAALLLEQAAAVPAPPSWRAEVAMRQARVALHAGQIRAASAYVCAAERAAPHSPDVRLFAAQTHLHQGDAAGAVEALRPLLHMTPGPTDLGRARALLQEAVNASAPPLSAADLAATQELLQTLEQYPSADELPHARLLVDAAPHPRVLTLAGLLALRLGATAEAIGWLERAQALNPLDPDPARILAGHYVASQEPMAAVAALRQAWHKNPFDAELAAELADREALLGDLQAAHHTTAALLVLEPNVPRHQEAFARLQAKLRGLAAPQSTPAAPRARLWPAPADTPTGEAACD